MLPLAPTIEVDLAALVRNYQLLASKHAHKSCGAVVKANAYGLGVGPVATALKAAGCTEFFVASLDEAIELRTVLPEISIYVFHGCRTGEAKEFQAHKLIPVLNDCAQWDAWVGPAPVALHVDTGMCRLGVPIEQLGKIGFTKHTPKLLLSHLACADAPEHPKNAAQLAAFTMARQHMPSVPASLANSSGVFLGAEYHFDLLRPGCSLYGISPNWKKANPMEHVATLTAPVLQIRELTKDETVGYGEKGHAKAGAILATVELGYADGFHRRLTGHGHGYAGGIKLPVIGRVSMDMVIMDITSLPAHLRNSELRVTFIGKEQPVDALAKAAGTIGYEIFTGLGKRVRRVYSPAAKG